MKKFKISVFIVMIGTLLSKVLGLLREMLLAQKYGTGYISDAFILSLNIPVVLISAIAGAVLNNYIPVYSDTEKKSEDESKKFNGVLLTIFGIISLFIIIAFLVFNIPILKIFAVGFEEEGFQYLSVLAKITIFSTYIIIITNILKGYLQYKNKFLGTSLDGILMNFGIIVGILLSSNEKFYLLGIGVLLGYFLSFICLAILASKEKFKAKLNLDLKNEYLKKILVLTIPIILNDVVWQVNGVVDKSVASTIGAGYISAINYAHYIVETISVVFATSIATVFFPKIVNLFKENGLEAVKNKTKVVLKYIVIIAIPATTFLILFAKDIIKVLFFRGNFNESSVDITSTAVSIYSIAILFTSIKTILFKVFYAMQDTKSPTKSAIVSIAINIVLTIILAKVFGYIGIIVATIVASIVSTILLIVMFHKKIGKLIDKEMIYQLVKIVAINFITLIIAIITNNIITNAFASDSMLYIIIRLLIVGIFSGGTYIALLLGTNTIKGKERV